MDGFNSILGIGKVEEVMMILDKLIGGRKLLVDLLGFKKNCKKVRQILLHWCYKLN